jgi:hypothetical protein
LTKEGAIIRALDPASPENTAEIEDPKCGEAMPAMTARITEQFHLEIPSIAFFQMIFRGVEVEDITR